MAGTIYGREPAKALAIRSAIARVLERATPIASILFAAKMFDRHSRPMAILVSANQYVRNRSGFGMRLHQGPIGFIIGDSGLSDA